MGKEKRKTQSRIDKEKNLIIVTHTWLGDSMDGQAAEVKEKKTFGAETLLRFWYQRKGGLYPFKLESNVESGSASTRPSCELRMQWIYFGYTFVSLFQEISDSLHFKELRFNFGNINFLSFRNEFFLLFIAPQTKNNTNSLTFNTNTRTRTHQHQQRRV